MNGFGGNRTGGRSLSAGGSLSPISDSTTVARFDHILSRGMSRARPLLHDVLMLNAALDWDLVLVAMTRTKRQGGHVFLRADVKAIRGGNPMTFEVFAEPTGTALHCGWQVTVKRLHDAVQHHALGGSLQARRDRRDGSAAADRNLARLTEGFQEAVFVPALERQVDAVGSGPVHLGPGFLGIL